MKTTLRGFSIVELLIAMTLGLVLSAGIIQVFLANRQAQRIEQSVARLQENGRIALDLITQDLRMAGYLGCGAVPDMAEGDRLFDNHIAALGGANNVFDNVDNARTFASHAVRGFSLANNNWTPALSQGVTAAAVAGAPNGSDVLAVYGAQQTDAAINGTVTGAAPITVDRLSMANSCFTQNQRVLVTSCDIGAELIEVTNSPNCNNAQLSLDHAGGNLQATYSDAGLVATSARRPRVLSFYSHAYFVRPSGRTRPDGTQVMSLFRWNGAQATELVEGIEFLRVEFGQKILNGANKGHIRYLSPTAIVGGDWTGITSVRIGVLAQSFDAVRDANDTATYTVAGQNIPAIAQAGLVPHGGGRILRQAYTTTVELRNGH